MTHCVVLKVKHVDGTYLSLDREGNDYRMFDYPTRGKAVGVAKRYYAREFGPAYDLVDVKEIHTLPSLTYLIYTVDDV